MAHVSSVISCSACSDADHAWLHSSSQDVGQRSLSLPDSSRSEWQVPLAPVRFPLRDALTSFQDPLRASVSEAEASSSSVGSRGPLRVQMTNKARDLKYLSHRKRYNLDPPGPGELPPTTMPCPPSECTKPKPPKKNVNTAATDSRTQERRDAENAGWSTWLVGLEHAKSEPDLRKKPELNKPTMTSAARAVLSHSRRFGGLSPSQSSTSLPDNTTGMSLTQSPTRMARGLPKPVKEWVCRGLEFTDAGLGIGDRFDVEIVGRANRAPGSIYETDHGNIGRYRPEASMPTKQPCARYGSTETHKMGARRDVSGKRDRQRPGPGTYETMGFAQELAYKLSKRPRGEAPRPLSPTASTS